MLILGMSSLYIYFWQLQCTRKKAYYASIMLNAFQCLLCPNYAGIIGTSLAHTYVHTVVGGYRGFKTVGRQYGCTTPDRCLFDL